MLKIIQVLKYVYSYLINDTYVTRYPQNEHKVATVAIKNYYRFKFLIMQALK